MKVKTITRRHRRDFTAIYECESCGHEHTDRGYDDAYFHAHVIPKMECPECGEASGRQTSEPVIPEDVVL